MSIAAENCQIVLRERPTGSVDPSLQGKGTFEVKKTPIPSADSLKDGEVLIKTLFASIDPAMRGWLRDARSYLPPVQIGEVMRAGTASVVVGSKDASLKAGDCVTGTAGWQEYAVLKAKTLTKLDMSIPGVNLVDWLGPLGSSGQTAYWGLMDVGQLKGNGEVVVITGAAGSVGSVVSSVISMSFTQSC